MEVLTHVSTSRGRVVIEGDIARVPQTAWGIWKQGWAPIKVRAGINIVRPVRMRGAADRTMVVLAPPQVCDLRGVHRGTKHCVAKGGMRQVSELGARSETGLLVSAGLESLKEGTSSSGSLPQHYFDRVQGRLEQPMLVMDHVMTVLNDPLGGCISSDAVMSEKVPEKLDGS